jgi:hypothetical protein
MAVGKDETHFIGSFMNCASVNSISSFEISPCFDVVAVDALVCGPVAPDFKDQEKAATFESDAEGNF